MTSFENDLIQYVVKEDFGEMAHSIVSFMSRKKSAPLFLIADELKLEKKYVAQILCNLINHGLVNYQQVNRNFVEYELNTKSCLNRLKFSW
jgi:hypothetical protein